jgi:hypothetical protein
MTTMRKLRILARNWQPRKLTPAAIRYGIRKILKQHGIDVIGKYVDEVRDPQQCRYVAEQSPRWHQDNRKQPRCYAVIWSNKNPTQIRPNPNSKALDIKAGDVVLFANHHFQHRLNPEGKRTRSRWFYRHHLQAKEIPRSIFKRV